MPRLFVIGLAMIGGSIFLWSFPFLDNCAAWSARRIPDEREQIELEFAWFRHIFAPFRMAALARTPTSA
jgi:hypothetical protein